MPAVEAEEFLGPCFILSCVSFILFGISCTQAFSYWKTYRDDHPLLRYTVLTIIILETLHTAMVLHFVYHYAIAAKSPLDLNRVVWSTIGLITSSLAVTFLTQMFYTWRIYQLSDGKLAASIAPAISLFTRCSLATTTSILVWLHRRWSIVSTDHTLHIILTLSLTLNVMTDMLLSVLFTYYLRKRKTVFTHTRSIIDTMLVYSVSTGAFGVFASLAVILLYLTVKSLAFAGMYILVAKVYANSMLVQLNSRNRRNKCGACNGVQEIQLSRIIGSDQGTSSNPQSHVGVHVDIVKQSVIDS